MDIYVARISDIIGEFGEDALYSQLPDFRKRAADVFVNPKDRQRSLVAGVLLVFCMNQRGVSVKETPCFGKNGKMYFPQADRFYVNLSHSGEYAACALDTQEIGVDVECLRQYRETVAQRIFSSEEMQSLFAGKEQEEKNRTFTLHWTKKESIAKLSGEGLGMLVGSRNNLPAADTCIYTKSYVLPSDYYLSVSSHEDCFPLQPRLLSPESLGQWH